MDMANRAEVPQVLTTRIDDTSLPRDGKGTLTVHDGIQLSENLF
jgi:hypothetical protein